MKVPDPNNVEDCLNWLRLNAKVVAELNSEDEIDVLDQIVLDNIARLARLGAAVEANEWYRCGGCDKPAPNPAHVTHSQECVDMDARSVSYYDISYCSNRCSRDHRKYIRT